MATQVAVMDADWVPAIGFGDRLRIVRRKRHRSQDEMAALLDVKKVTYASWEAGRTPSLEEIQGIARRLYMIDRVPQWWTLGAEEPRPSGPGGDAAEVRHQGLEPRTRWFDGSPDREYEFSDNGVDDPRVHRPLAAAAEVIPFPRVDAQQWAAHELAAAA